MKIKFLPHVSMACIVLSCITLPILSQENEFPQDDVSIAPVPSENELMIKRLGAEDAGEREKAEKEIWDKGKELLPLLLLAAQSDDPEVAVRAQRLIPRIKFSLPREEKSPLREFADKYIYGDAINRNELLMNALVRDKLDYKEAKTLLRIAMEHPPEDPENESGSIFPTWILEKFYTLLWKQTMTYLDNGQVKPAVDLWEDVDFSPVILRKYCAMLYNAGLPLILSGSDESVLTELQTEFSFLTRNREQVEEKAPFDNKRYAELLASVNFDLEGKWSYSLEKTASIKNCSYKNLPMLWVIARLKNDAHTQTAIEERLMAKIHENDINSYDGFDPDDDIQPVTSLDACKLILSLGKREDAFNSITKFLANNTLPLNRLNRIYDFTASPYFNIKDMGTAEETRQAVLDLAHMIMPLRAEQKKQSIHIEESEYYPLNQKQTLISQKLLILGSYLEQRGYGNDILPYIRAHIASLPAPLDGYLACQYILSLCSTLENNTRLAFQIYLHAVDNDIIKNEEIYLCEQNFFSSIINPDSETEWSIYRNFIKSLNEKALPRTEITRQALVLLGTLESENEESREILDKAIVSLKKSRNAEISSMLAKLLVKSPYSPLDHVFTLCLELDLALWWQTSYGDTFSKAEFIYHVETYGSEKLKTLYREYFRSELEKSSLFSSQTSNGKQDDKADKDLKNDFFWQEWPMNQYAECGEYLAALIRYKGDKENAGRLRKKARLYNLSEYDARSCMGILMGVPGISCEEMLEEMFPAYVVQNEFSDSIYIPDFTGMYSGFHAAGKLLSEGKFKESYYFFEAANRELLKGPLLELLSCNVILESRGFAEIARGLYEWKAGNKEKAKDSLETAQNILTGISFGNFIWYVSRQDPELKDMCEAWYDQKRGLYLSVLEKWPDYGPVIRDLVESSLILNKHPEETHKLISGIKNKNLHREMSLLKNIFDLIQKGNRETAGELTSQLIRAKSNPTTCIADSIHYELFRNREMESVTQK